MSHRPRKRARGRRSKSPVRSRQTEQDGSAAIQLIAAELTAPILRALVYGPKTVDQLSVEVEADRDHVRAKTEQMIANGLIRPVNGQPNGRHEPQDAYEATRAGRTLALIAYMAARVEWAMDGHDGPRDGYTLVDILDLLVPGARVRPSVKASCVLVERYADGSRPIRARLTLRSGAIAIEPVGADDSAQVRASGEPQDWHEAFATLDPDKLVVIGDSDLLYEVVRALMAQ